MKVTVIGAGPGGYEAALYAAKRGLEVTLVEKGQLGGTCLNRGCIPTKALLAVSDTLSEIREAKSLCINVPDGTTADYSGAFARKDKVVGGLTSGIAYLMKANGVRVLNGMGKLLDRNHVEVALNDGATEVVETDKIILATGSYPACPAMFKYDGKRVVTSDELLSMSEQPDSLLIIGGGVIGCEIAQFFCRMGTKVTIVEALPHILPNEDKDVIRPLERKLKQEGIAVHCAKSVQVVNVNDDCVGVQLSDGTKLTASVVLVSIGRRPETRGLNLDGIQLATNERGFIEVNEYMQTKTEGVYAIGDIVPTPQLAHVASYEAFIAVDHIISKPRKADYRAVPRCVYTSPEIAGVGLTETAAAAKGIDVHTGRYDFMGLGKAKAAGKTEGFVKLITDANDVIIGGAVVGAHGTELLEAITLATHLGLTAEQLGQTIFPHPTMGEAILEAAHDVHKLSVHK